MSIQCPNPDCPAVNTPSGNVYSSERAFGAHLGRSVACDEWVESHPDADPDQPPFPLPLPFQPPAVEDPPSGDVDHMDVDDEPRNEESGPSFRYERIAGAAKREPQRFGTEWEHRKAKEKRPGSPWFPFISAEAYDVAQWAIQTKQKMSDIDALLKTRYVKNSSCKLGFRSAQDMRDIIESEFIPSPPPWKSAVLKLSEIPDEPQTLYYRDPHLVIDHLFGKPDFADSMDYEPVRVFDEKTGHRVYHEFSTGDLWWKAQNDAKTPAGATIIPIILASDKTHLTNQTGGLKAHPLYLSIANIQKGVRSTISRGAWVLLAYIPILESVKTTFKNKTMKSKMPGILSKRLFHKALKKIFHSLQKEARRRAVDASGYWRDTLRRLMVYIADMEEVWIIAGLGFYCCPFCQARKNDLDSATIFPPRSSRSILAAVATVRAAMHGREGVERGSAEDTYSFALAASKAGLGPVEDLFYEAWVNEYGFDIKEALTHDPLHWDHKCFADHVLVWNQNIIDGDTEFSEIDMRLRLQIPRPGFRHFSKGISQISQWTQGDTRDLEKEFIAATAGAPGVTPALMDANRTYLDYIYMASYPYHTDESIRVLEQLVARFEVERQVYIDLKGRKGEASGEVIDNFIIPKIHVPRHVPDDIRGKGGLDALSTEISERLHIETTKDAFRATNHRDHEPQMMRWLDQRERMAIFEQYMIYREDLEEPKTKTGGVGESGGEGGARDEEEREEVVKTKIERRTWQVPNPEKHDVDFWLTARPHAPGASLQDIIKSYRLFDLYTDLLKYFQDEGLSGVPSSYATVDIWTAVRLLLPIPNDFMKTEWRRVHANPAQSTFDSVLINEGNANVVGLEGYRAAELRVIFRANNPNRSQKHPMPQIFAYVYLFTPIPQEPEPNSKMFKITKQFYNTPSGWKRQGMVVKIEDIIRPCPISPFIVGKAERYDKREGEASAEVYYNFLINSFGSLNEHMCLVR